MSVLLHTCAAMCSSQTGVTISVELERSIPDHVVKLEQAHSSLTLLTNTASKH